MRQSSPWYIGKILGLMLAASFIAALAPVSTAHGADEPDLIFRRSTVFKWLTPNDKLATYGGLPPIADFRWFEYCGSRLSEAGPQADHYECAASDPPVACT